LFLPFCVEAIRPIGITSFQTIATGLFESSLGFGDLSAARVNEELAATAALIFVPAATLSSEYL
jgi:hypothetical protein